MKTSAGAVAGWSRNIAVLALGSALAGCSGGGGNGGGNGNVNVVVVPTTSLAVTPTTIALGQSARLTWSSSQSASCEATGSWEGPEPANGMLDVTPTITGTVAYALTCPGGGLTQAVFLTVVPASVYTATSLVEDFTGGAATTTDAHLVNPWGLTYAPTSAIWVANNHAETATIYTGNGTPAPTAANPLVVQLESVTGGASFDPTGVVFNITPDFAVTRAGLSGEALFIFAGEGGMIAGWSPAVDVTHAITMYAAPDGAVYKGLTLANNGAGNFLFATDFANGKIDVFDATFTKQAAAAATFAFDDPTLPDGYAPFGIEAIGNGAGGATQIYVSYAKKDQREPDEDAPGPGLGLVDAFDTNGNFLRRVVNDGGHLNAPWGLALAPGDFGTLSGALLVGNFGDGTIQGYDPSTGRYLGAVSGAGPDAFAVPGLWGIRFGNDAVNQPHATLFFTAGINDETNGRYGRIDLGSSAPALGNPPVVSLSLPQGDLAGTVTLTADVVDAIPVSEVRFLNGSTPIGTATTAPFSVQWNTATAGNGGHTLRAVATDENGNVGSSAIVAVNVVNVAADDAYGR